MKLHQPFYIEPRTGEPHMDLCGEAQWDYCYADSPRADGADIRWRGKTKLPASAAWTLYRAGELPHPYEQNHHELYAWIGYKVWYYRRSFYVDAAMKDRIAFLCFDGSAYDTRVWMNGSLLGEHSGMFGGPMINASSCIRCGAENEILVEVTPCSYRKGDWRDRNRNPNGINTEIVPWGAMYDAKTSTGTFAVVGLWGNVRIEFLPAVHLSRPYLYTRELSADKATLRLSTEISRKGFDELEVLQDYTDPDHRFTNPFARGLTGAVTDDAYVVDIRISEKHSGKQVYHKDHSVALLDDEKSGADPEYAECQFFETDIGIDSPKCWYPNGIGEAFLYSVSLRLRKNETILDEHTFDFGIRKLTMTRSAGNRYKTRWGDFQMLLNGNPLFLQGMNWLPADMLYDRNRDKYRWLLWLAKKAGIQLLRVWSGGGFPEDDAFYQLCDEYGIMVWQDWPIANCQTQNYPQDVLEAQVAMNIYRIRNHASLVIHCGGNEFNPYCEGNAASMFVIWRSVHALDPSRPFFFATPDGGSAHIYQDIEPTMYRIMYKQLPFIAESGVNSFPPYQFFRKTLPQNDTEGRLPALTDERFEQLHPELTARFVLFRRPFILNRFKRAMMIADLSNATLKEWCEVTQVAACEHYQMMIQSARELYPVTTGIMPWAFNRAWENVGMQLVDGMGMPTAQYYYVKKAYQGLNVSACFDRLVYAPGETLNAEIKILNSTALDAAGMTVVSQVFSPELALVTERRYIVGARNTMEVAIPDNFGGKTFFIRLWLVGGGERLSESLYWIRCASDLLDAKNREAYLALPRPNTPFPSVTPLFTQIQSLNDSNLAIAACDCAVEKGQALIDITLTNQSAQAAFPVMLEETGLDLPCLWEDNFFLLAGGETRRIRGEVWLKGDRPAQASVCVSAWNQPPVAAVASRAQSGP